MTNSPSEWSRRLVAALVSAGRLDSAGGDTALAQAGEQGRPVAEILARGGTVDSAAVLAQMAQLSGLAAVDIYTERPMGEAFKLVPESLAKEFGAIGYRIDGSRLTLATIEPLSSDQMRNLSAFLEREISGCVLADPLGIQRVMEAVYPRLAGSGDGLSLTGAEPSSNGQQASGSAPPPPPPPPAPPPPPSAPEFAGVGSSGGSDESTAMYAPVGADYGSYAGEYGGGEYASVAAPAPPYSYGYQETGSGTPGAVIQQKMPPGFRPPSHEVRSFAEIAAGKSGLDIDDLLTYAVENGASDLHLTNQLPPAIRVDGSIRPIEGLPRLDNEQIREMVFGILTQSLRERFEADKELDTSHSIMGVGRFRVNVFQQRGSIGSVLRAIPHEIPPFETLGLPEVVSGLAELRRGLVLVTGPTGSGKSTTLASLVSIINRTKPLHIVTVEDPIEFLHSHDRAIVNQREVGADTSSFSEALRHVLRQDPDVILVGEMRDIETISTALTAAETGHLVFATLHTQDAPQTVDRIIDVFPTNQQDQVRIQLAGSLEAVVTQQLIISATGLGRVPVSEVMIASPAIRNLIRSAKTHQIYSLMQTGGAQGMQTMDQGLARAVRQGKITEAIAFDRCHDANELRDHLKVAE